MADVTDANFNDVFHAKRELGWQNNLNDDDARNLFLKQVLEAK